MLLFFKIVKRLLNLSKLPSKFPKLTRRFLHYIFLLPVLFSFFIVGTIILMLFLQLLSFLNFSGHIKFIPLGWICSFRLVTCFPNSIFLCIDNILFPYQKTPTKKVYGLFYIHPKEQPTLSPKILLRNTNQDVCLKLNVCDY